MSHFVLTGISCSLFLPGVKGYRVMAGNSDKVSHGWEAGTQGWETYFSSYFTCSCLWWHCRDNLIEPFCCFVSSVNVLSWGGLFSIKSYMSTKLCRKAEIQVHFKFKMVLCICFFPPSELFSAIKGICSGCLGQALIWTVVKWEMEISNQSQIHV